MAYLPGDHDRPLGTCSKVDPLKLVYINKINTFNIIYQNLLITDQMALKYHHVCLFKPVFINVKVTWFWAVNMVKCH